MSNTGEENKSLPHSVVNVDKLNTHMQRLKDRSDCYVNSTSLGELNANSTMNPSTSHDVLTPDVYTYDDSESLPASDKCSIPLDTNPTQVKPVSLDYPGTTQYPSMQSVVATPKAVQQQVNLGDTPINTSSGFEQPSSLESSMNYSNVLELPAIDVAVKDGVRNSAMPQSFQEFLDSRNINSNVPNAGVNGEVGAAEFTCNTNIAPNTSQTVDTCVPDVKRVHMRVPHLVILRSISLTFVGWNVSRRRLMWICLYL